MSDEEGESGETTRLQNLYKNDSLSLLIHFRQLQSTGTITINTKEWIK